MIRAVRNSDASAICEIYNHFVRESIATFDEVPISERDIGQRIVKIVERFPWYTWEEEGTVAGYAYAAPWMSRSAYRFAVETTIYVSPDFARRGIGTRLYEAVLESLRESGFHSAVAGISLPNPASIGLHEKLGFRRIAVFEEIGFKFGRWIDVGYWELLLKGESR